VAILPDNDEPGRKHARDVALSLRGIATQVKVVDLPGLPKKGDVSDWLAAGHGPEELLRLVEKAPAWAAGPTNEEHRGARDERETQAQALMRLGCDAELFKTPAGIVYARGGWTGTSRLGRWENGVRVFVTGSRTGTTWRPTAHRAPRRSKQR